MSSDCVDFHFILMQCVISRVANSVCPTLKRTQAHIRILSINSIIEDLQALILSMWKSRRLGGVRANFCPTAGARAAACRSPWRAHDTRRHRGVGSDGSAACSALASVDVA